ncbi:hypothetical protein SDC9_159919 [bioreactor metagenome]|uniref:Uncharacterized protein n=1 Tax=bioreactor metagenome TaxID=1076179 RepID=A0A645FDY8_9ZZZZ
MNRLQAKGECGRAVHDNVDPQQLQRGKRRFQAQQDGGQNHNDRGHVDRKLKADKPLKVLVNAAPPLDGVDDGGKGIVEQNNVAGFFGNLCAGNTHSNTYVSVFQRRRVVDTVSRDSHHITHVFEQLNHTHFDRRRTAGNHIDVWKLAA